MIYLVLYKWCPKICSVALTCGGPDGGGDSGRGHGGDTVIVLGVASLDGPQVAVASGSETAGQVQSLHGLWFYLAEHRLAHWLKLAIYLCLTHLWETKAIGIFSPSFSKWGYFFVNWEKLIGWL